MTEPIRDVLLLVADQWRADALGLLGTPGVRTPNLDALAERSVVFTNHWCQASPCGPARSTLLTGTEAPTHGQWTNDGPVTHGLPTLPGAARAAGMAPLLIGYTDTPWTAIGDHRPGSGEGADPQLFDPAFELVRPFFWQLGFPAYRRFLLERGYGPLSEDRAGIFPMLDQPDRSGPAPSRIEAADSDVAWLTDAAVEVIRQRSEPMLLHVNWLRPHPPLIAPAPYHRLVDPEEVARPERGLTFETQLGRHPYFDLVARDRSMSEYVQRRATIETIDEGDERRLRAAYYGLCAEVDHHLGRVLTELRASGRDRSTLIVFLSDHGDAMGEHWLYGRRGPFDGHFQVPCIVHDPRPSADAARGSRVEAFTANIDIMATILDAIGQPTPRTVEGRSLSPFLRGDDPGEWRQEVRLWMDWTGDVRRSRRPEVASLDRLRFGVVRTDRHRYVEFDGMAPLLFDRHEDPGELVDLAADAAYQAIREHLASVLAA